MPGMELGKIHRGRRAQLSQRVNPAVPLPYFPSSRWCLKGGRRKCWGQESTKRPEGFTRFCTKLLGH